MSYKTSLIYKITNKVNNKIYIGQTSKSLEERWKTHKAKHSNKKVNLLLYNSMRKYGIENFKIEIISFTLDEIDGDFSVKFNNKDWTFLWEDDIIDYYYTIKNHLNEEA